jgi:hypothetical protein
MNTNSKSIFAALVVAAVCLSGCTTIKQSDTSRTGIEQLLISSAADRALDKFDLHAIAGAKVFVDTKYFDCTDKNYVLVALHEKLLANHCTLVEKADDCDVVLEIGSGGVGTDRNDMYLGFPGLSLPPSVAIPRIALFERDKAMGTVKLAIVAIDNKTKQPVINSGYQLARADHRHWQILGLGSQQSGSVQEELVAKTGEDSSIVGATRLASSSSGPSRQ